VKLSVQLLLLLLFAFFHGELTIDSGRMHLLLLPILMVSLGCLSFATGALLAASAAKYRDLLHIVPTGVQLLMYATPVIYPLSTVPPHLRGYLSLNPLSAIFESTRFVLLGSGNVSISLIVYPATLAIVLVVVAVRVFHFVERNVVDTI
jgi:lipopolysaccharide transport system permease protein